jgi:hypothetical protein
MTRICNFLRDPSNNALVMIQGLCQDMVKRFMDGSLLKDCFHVLGSLTQRDLKVLRRTTLGMIVEAL